MFTCCKIQPPKKGNKTMITLNDFYAFYEGEYTKEFLDAMLGSMIFLSLNNVRQK